MVKNIRVEPLKDFVKYVIYTGFVENIPYPVSGLIIAPPEHAKSTEVEKFECLGTMQVDKTTAWGLADIIQGMSARELEIYHHFIMLDLENFDSMSRDVKKPFMAFVRQLQQEGAKHYHTARINLDLEVRKSFGFIMCTTPEDLGDRRSAFRSLSFLSRPVPFTYKYGIDTRRRILDYVAEEEHNEKQRYIIKREEKAEVELPKKYAVALNIFALVMARRIESVAHHPKTVFNGEASDEQLCGIRSKENLMGLLKAIALYHGRRIVIREDFDELRALYRFMNFKFNDIGEEKQEGTNQRHLDSD